MGEQRLRRIAAHEVIVDGRSIRMCVVELRDGYVTDCYAFTEELPFTEWIGGTIEIVTDESGRKVLSPSS